MLKDSDLETLRSATVYAAGGEKVGSVGDVYLDDADGRPAWITVETGMLGGRARIVPLDEARFERGDLVLPFTKQAILDAPEVTIDEQLTANDESTLRGYYYHEGRDPQIPVTQAARSGDHAEQVGDALRTDRPAGDFVDETDLDTLYDENGRIVPTAATASDARVQRVDVEDRARAAAPRTDATLDGQPGDIPSRPVAVDGGRSQVDSLGPDNGRRETIIDAEAQR